LFAESIADCAGVEPIIPVCVGYIIPLEVDILIYYKDINK
jgi:hypothetical protein